MAFAHVLQRLRAAVSERHRGTHADQVVIQRNDLVELLHHFDRLDGEARSEWASVRADAMAGRTSPEQGTDR